MFQRSLTALAFAFVCAGPMNCSCPAAEVDGTVPEGGDCDYAQDCVGELVCDPGSETCEGEVECETNADCGNGAICATGGACAVNVSGGTCDVDVDCVNGEDCRSGNCLVPGAEGSDCDSAEECADALVCEPGAGACTTGTDVSCTDHDDCGVAAFCDDGACAVATSETFCDSDADCTADARCLGVVCIPDVCEGDAFSAEPVPANLLITIDRSGSMRQEIGNDGRKWDVARDAVYQLMSQPNDQIRYGLNLYPGSDQDCDNGDQCGAGIIPVDVGGAPGDITNYLQNAGTCSGLGTPTAENLEMVLDYTPLQDTERNNYILLITDGQSTCDNPVSVVGDLVNRTPTTPTFVVGFGNGVDPDELEDMAVEAGTDLPGNPAYYEADDAASLQQALADIVGSVLSCEYDVPGQFDDPDLLIVFFNGQRVPPDPSGTTGWSFSPQAGRLTFAGNACTALRSGIVTDLTIVYGCPLDGPPGVDAGPPPVDAGQPIDAGTPPPQDAGPPGGDCDNRCINNCGANACLVDQGRCGECGDDNDCCPGALCLPDGACIPLGG